jgi:hypothetical protein
MNLIKMMIFLLIEMGRKGKYLKMLNCIVEKKKVWLKKKKKNTLRLLRVKKIKKKERKIIIRNLIIIDKRKNIEKKN